MKNSVEGTVFNEAKRFVAKDPTKLKLVVGLYALSMAGLEVGRTVRASYFFARHLDDLLDGEMSVGEDPVLYALNIRDQIISDEFDTTSPIANLAAASLSVLERKSKPEDNPRLEFVQLIDALLFDHRRIQSRATLSQDELTCYYRNVLDPGLNLMLMGFGSDIRSRDIPTFSPALGGAYSVRDLEKDWELGIINIPASVLSKANLTSVSQYPDVVSNLDVQQWAIDEVRESRLALAGVTSVVAATDERLSKLVLGGFISQAVKIEPQAHITRS